MKMRPSFLILFLFLEMTESLITTLLVYDAQSRASLSGCLNLFHRANINVLQFEANSSQSLEYIHSGVCAHLEKVKDLKAIVDYSTAETVNRLLDGISQRLHVPLLRMNSSVVSEFGSQPFQFMLYPEAVLKLLVLKDFLHKENRKGRWQKAVVLLPPRSKDLKNLVSVVQGAEQAIPIRLWSESMDLNNKMIDRAVDNGVQDWIVDLTSNDMRIFFELMSVRGLMKRQHRFLVLHSEMEEEALKSFAYAGADIQFFRPNIGGEKEPLTERLTRIATEIILPLKQLSTWNSSCFKGPWSDGEEALDKVRGCARQDIGIIENPKLLGTTALDFNVQIRRMTRGGSVQVYSWNSIQGLVASRQRVKHHSKRADRSGGPGRPKVVVTTIISPPFVQFAPIKNKDGKANVGNARFTGLSIEIFKLIAKRLKIDYTLVLVKDGQYGSRKTARNGFQRWNGMIGELLRREADIAVAPLLITYTKETVVDFSRAYLRFGVSAILQKPMEVQNPIKFCDAFSLELWCLVIGAAIVTSIVLYFTAHVSPSEWQQKEDNQSNDFSFTNSLWLITGAFVLKGTNLSARSTATRLVCLVWWLFILCLLLSYFAVTLQFLKYEKMEMPIKSVEDLADQSYIKYGAVDGSPIYKKFRYSPIPVYKRMFNFMQEHSSFTRSTSEGMRRVHQGNFAFLLDSTISSMHTARNCSLISFGSSLSQREYGFAFAKDSPFKVAISMELQRLIEEQYIEGIVNFWLRKQGIKSPCPSHSDNKTTYRRMNIHLMSYLFYGLMAGLIIALVISVCEICFRSCRKRDRGEMTSSEYLQMAFSSWGSKRPSRPTKGNRDVECPLKECPTQRYG